MNTLNRIRLDHINIAELVALASLCVALIYSMINQYMELSMSIASGLLGYIGGTSSSRMGHLSNIETSSCSSTPPRRTPVNPPAPTIQPKE